MKKTILFYLSLFLFASCDSSKWETINGQGINEKSKNIEEVIYFEDENNGVVGGYSLIEDKHSQYGVKLSMIPALYLTTDGGGFWTEIKFDPTIKQSVRNAYLHLDTLICQTDSLILFSKDKGKSFLTYADSNLRYAIIRKYLNENKTNITERHFQYEGTDYSIKERYHNDSATVIVCYGPKSLTDYYFVSFDEGKKWTFLEKDFGDNRQRFLLGDKFLYYYHFPFGLKRLKLN